MVMRNKKIAKLLLQSKAIKLEPAKPFKWASGWHSPIYCDNRITLSFPEIRDYIRDQFTEVIGEEFPGVNLIAGVATGAIAQGALVADRMRLPFVYIRSDIKDHGRKNQVEGYIPPGSKAVIVEDLISTGGSSLKAVSALTESNCSVLGMVSIFTYGFEEAEKRFEKAEIKNISLSNYDTLLELAVDTGYITQDQIKILNQWRKDPANWKLP